MERVTQIPALLRSLLQRVTGVCACDVIIGVIDPNKAVLAILYPAYSFSRPLTYNISSKLLNISKR